MIVYPHQTETGRKGVKAESVRLLRRCGCFVLILPVRMTGGFRLLPEGTPDAIASANDGAGTLGWLEWKRGRGGKLSAKQIAFRDAALRRGEKWAAPQSAEESLRAVMGWGAKP